MIKTPRCPASKDEVAKAQTTLAWILQLPLDHDYVVKKLARDPGCAKPRD
jgi:hypothetical protein